MKGEDDALVEVKPLLDMFGDWGKFLGEGLKDSMVERLKKHSRTGWPLGSEAFVKELEKKLGHKLIPKEIGRPKKVEK